VFKKKRFKKNFYKYIHSAVLLLFMLLSPVSTEAKTSSTLKFTEISFNQDGEYKFSDKQQKNIRNLIVQSHASIQELLVNLPSSITVEIEIEMVDRDLDLVGGVIGKAESNFPSLIIIQISNSYKNGNIDEIRPALESTIFHEFHHLARGWAVRDNKFARCLTG
jgi:hypothetical protein